MEYENKLNNVIKTRDSMTDKIGNLLSTDIRNAKINFDYDSLEGLEEGEKAELSKCEKSLLFQGKQMGVMTFEIGKALYKAKEILKKTQSDSFMKWYEALGLSKDQVSLFIGRYQLVIDYPTSKDRILMLSDVAVKETLNKNTPQEVVEKVLNGEIATSKQIKSARKNISRALEIEKVQEAQIVEKSDKVTFIVSMEMIDNIEKKLNKIKKNINKNKGMELKSYIKLEGVLEILEEIK